MVHCCIYTHTCTHTYNIHIYVHTYTHTYKYTYTYTYTYIYTFTYMSFKNTHAQTCTHTHTHTHHRFTLISSVCVMAHVIHTKLGTKVEYQSKEEDAEHGKRRLKVCDSLSSPPSLPFLPSLSHANSNSLVHKTMIVNFHHTKAIAHCQSAIFDEFLVTLKIVFMVSL